MTSVPRRSCWSVRTMSRSWAAPGPNDNGSGVAALLELARILADPPLARRLRFVAFVNEEPPFSQTAEMGSVVHANAAGARGERLSAMLSLETIGYYSDAPGSQPVQRMESRGACVALRLALIARRIRPLSGKIGKYCGNRGSCLPPRG